MRALALVWLLAALPGCSRGGLEQAYRDLYVSRHAIDFPSDQAALENCRSMRLTKCIAVYDQAKRGREAVLAAEPSKAMTHALDAAGERCLSGPRHDPELCEGALVSLYFFVDVAQDATLLDAMKRFQPGSQSVIFGGQPYEWFGNRPQPRLWVEFIQTLPESTFSRVSRRHVLELFLGAGGGGKRGAALL